VVEWVRRPEFWGVASTLLGLGALVAVYAATRVTLPRVPCTVPTAAQQHAINTAVDHVNSDISVAKILAGAGVVMIAAGVWLNRPRTSMARFGVIYGVALGVVILYGVAYADDVINRGCGI
jgi:hypothetical protein